MPRIWVASRCALIMLLMTEMGRFAGGEDVRRVASRVHGSSDERRRLQEGNMETNPTREVSKTLVQEDADFDPYNDNNQQDADNYVPMGRKAKLFDFDPSEGLTFYVAPSTKECFYQDAKFAGDTISGAFIVSSADSHIDLVVNNPQGTTIYRRYGDAEGQYEVNPSEEGVHAICFDNSDTNGKLITHVTNRLQSQHPVEREHVSVLAKYASHIDVRLGELESEQRVTQIRTDRHIKIEESTSRRVSLYGTIECMVYLMVCLFQVVYIKRLLDNPRGFRNWA